MATLFNLVKSDGDALVGLRGTIAFALSLYLEFENEERDCILGNLEENTELNLVDWIFV